MVPATRSAPSSAVACARCFEVGNAQHVRVARKAQASSPKPAAAGGAGSARDGQGLPRFLKRRPAQPATDVSNPKAKPASRAPGAQPQDQPELAKVEPMWDDKQKRWVYRKIAYKAFKGSSVIGGIEANDVQQGMIGDCYLMAALVALAATNPSVIEDAITSDGPDTWRVRLCTRRKGVFNQFAATESGGIAYGESVNRGKKTVSIGTSYVDPRYNDPLFDMDAIPADAAKKDNLVEVVDYDHLELWPAIIEKAYALHAPLLGVEKAGSRAGGYDDIGEGGGSHTAFEALTGKPAAQTLVTTLGAGKLPGVIDAALKAGKPVAAGTPGNAKTLTEKIRGAGPVYSDHAYAVLSLKGQEIELRNPWRLTYKPEDLESRPELRTKDNSGIIKLTLDEFRKEFDALYIGASVTPVK
jgi:hypothetical protein